MSLPDGPSPPNLFAFAGETFEISSPAVWRLMNHVWNSPNRQASVNSLGNAVWNDIAHDISYLALATLRRNSNRFFRQHDLPFQMRISQEVVLIKDLDSKKD